MESRNDDEPGTRSPSEYERQTPYMPLPLPTPDDVAGPWQSVPGGIEWHRGAYTVSTDPGRLDIAALTDVLAATYWATDIPEDVVRRSVASSVNFGLYH